MDSTRAEQWTPDSLRSEVDRWLVRNAERLAAFAVPGKRAMEEVVPHEIELQRMLFDAGFTRLGWPPEVGGFGGSMVLRGVVYDAVYAAGYPVPETLEPVEIIGAALAHFAPELANAHLPRALAGEEVWCQGFSEPGAGSDLAGLETRAFEHADGFRVRGQKVWTTLAQFATHCCVLARTGEAKSGYRGLGMFFVDLGLPGVSVRPILAANGRAEFAEVFLDDTVIGKECLIGPLDGGWGVAMYLLQFERGMYAWMRQARLHARLAAALSAAGREKNAVADRVGDAYLTLFALRAKARQTVLRLAAGETPGPEISIDKVLLSAADQAVYDVTRRLTSPRFELAEGPDADVWRAEWFYSRATSIYGGAVEIQRDIISERLLGLPKGRATGS